MRQRQRFTISRCRVCQHDFTYDAAFRAIFAVERFDFRRVDATRYHGHARIRDAAAVRCRARRWQSVPTRSFVVIRAAADAPQCRRARRIRRFSLLFFSFAFHTTYSLDDLRHYYIFDARFRPVIRQFVASSMIISSPILPRCCLR